MKGVAFTTSAAKALAKLPADIRQRIIAKIDRYAAGQSADVKAMVGEDGAARMRVGDYRIIFIETADAIQVVAIGNRREIYR